MNFVWHVRRKVTIVIPTRNEVDYARTCLTGPVRRTVFEPYDVILSDNGNTDGMLENVEFLRNLGYRPHDQTPGLRGSVNRALEASDHQRDAGGIIIWLRLFPGVWSPCR